MAPPIEPRDPVEQVRRDVETLRDGLFGSDMIPGGLIGTIRGEIADIRVDLRTIRDSLPVVISAAIVNAKTESRSRLFGEFVSAAWKIATGVAIVIAAALIVTHYGLHSP